MMRRILPALSLLILFCLLPLAGQSAFPPGGPEAGIFRELPSGVPDNPLELLGMTLEEALRTLGLPVGLSSVRGEESWQDDVVFTYGNHISLYWFEDRVWQIRFDRDFRGIFYGLQTGVSSGEVSRILGRKPGATGPDWELYFLSGPGFPVRLQIFYREGRADDYYLYRGDF